MKQSSALQAAVIRAGNGRWAQARGLPRSAGHREGARAVERLVEAAPDLGIGTLTLYAFSSDNWSRPRPVVTALMRLFRGYLRSERARAEREGVAIEVIGRRDRLPVGLLEEIARTEAATAAGARLRLRIAVDYSSRDAIRRAAIRLGQEPGEPTPERFARLLHAVDHGRADTPAVDLLIRTGGERRLSDFLLWECAYAELFFRDTMWPDFTVQELREIVAAFRRRERRFGGLPAPARPPVPLRLTR